MKGVVAARDDIRQHDRLVLCRIYEDEPTADLLCLTLPFIFEAVSDVLLDEVEDQKLLEGGEIIDITMQVV